MSQSFIATIIIAFAILTILATYTAWDAYKDYKHDGRHNRYQKQIAKINKERKHYE